MRLKPRSFQDQVSKDTRKEHLKIKFLQFKKAIYYYFNYVTFYKR